MSRRAHLFTMFLVVLLPVLLCLAPGARAQDGVATDKAALVALYSATDGANWTTNTNWSSEESLSSWHGVTTNSDGRVTALALNDNGLDGTLPTALGDLSELEQLDLQDNDLSGALPSELANLTNLTSLLLTESRALTGPLPDGLRELSDLETVSIDRTELCAPDGDAFRTWLSTITFSGLICPPAEQSVIDVAVFYTSAARENTGGTDEIATAIDLMVAETNMAYMNSGANQRINLVAAEEVVGYRETNDLAIDIFRLRLTSDGYMDEIHDIRDEVAADIVLLIAAGLSGRAFQLSVPSTSSESRAFGVVNAYSSSTFAHELGHIMGLRHDRYEVCGDNCGGFTLFPYAFGYVNQEALEPGAPDTAFWRTIMAYPNQCGPCPTILRFSNPDQIHPDPGGDPLGKAGLEPAAGAGGPSDAVRMLNRTRGYVANYRTAPAITVSFDAETYTATEGGTAATVTVGLSDAPGRAIDIPVTATSTTGAAASDYTVPASVAFATNQTQRTFTLTAVDDAVDDDNETVTLTLGYLLPGGVTAGSPATATVTLTDNDTVTGAPSILSVSLTSDPGGGYAAGEEIEATVSFDKTVIVTGSPQLGLMVGSNTRQASYQGVARNAVTFSYEVAADETDSDGVSIAANALSLNSGTIRDSANRNAVLTHSALAASANHRVDGVKPVLQTAVVDETILTLTYDEPLAQPSPRASAFFTVAVTHPGGGRYAPEIVVDGSVMTVTLWDPVLAGQVVTVKFSNHNIPAFGTPHLIRDLAGNPAASLRRHAVTNVTKERPYDTDGDGLIEVTTLAQLDAVRHDRDGDGVPTAAGASTYRAAFPDAFVEVGSQLRCVLECRGYELMADLDFDTDDDGDVDAGDTYWNSGAGWNPIGSSGSDFLTTFEGNGHTIRNLLIDRPSTNYVGLFGYTDWKANIRNVGLIQVDVEGRTYVAGLVGNNLGTITACYATGQVSGLANIGGLAGSNYSSVRSSYAAAQVSGRLAAGGLVGRNLGTIIDASYATGEVSGRSSVGGLVGYEDGNTIRASYATGRVSGETSVGGLVGGLDSSTITASYWDTTTSGQTTGDHGTGQTTAQLQAPTDNTGIYADWDADQWDFGMTDEYPVLVVDFDGDGDATWEEFGYQLREGPTLTATFESGGVILTWTEVDADHWDPAPDVAYSLYREAGSTFTTLAEKSSARTYTDTGAVVGETYTYQVAAVVDGGGATRSSRVSVTVPDTTPPTVSKVEITSNPGTDRTYAADEEIQVTVTFSETVEVTGTPRLSLELGGGSRTATYEGGSGTAALVFAYEVADGESDTDGVGVEADSLSGGTIEDTSDNPAMLDHDGLSADSNHKVDGVKPGLTASGGAVVNGTTLTLTYDEPLSGSSTPEAGDFTVTGGDRARTVTRVTVSGSTVVLTLDTAAEHLEAGIQVSYTPGTNKIRDVAGNEAEALSQVRVTNETPDTSPPEVSSLAISSNPGSDQTYAAGDEIEVTVTFSETVEVEGTPQLRLRVGTKTRTAGYLSGTGTAALVFGYEVADGDEDTGGVSIEAGRIALNRGTIEDEADNDAVLDHEAVAPQAEHQVDGVRPVFVSAAVDGSSLTLTYGEALDGGSRPASGDFTVEVGGSGRSVTGVSVSGSVVTLTLNPAVEHGDTGIRVSYTVPTGVGANPIQDEVGNDARGLSSRSVTNTTGAPNTVPEITSPSSFDVRENQLVVRRLAARDTDAGDEVTGWEIVGGADQSEFSIASDTGELSFRDPPDFEGPGDNEYVVTVEVTSGAGARELEAEQTFTISVTDEREPPDVPEVPTFSGETADSLTVRWSEPDNTGPAITDYDVQYREKGTGRFIDGDQQGPGLTLTLEDLEPGTVYEVQVRAKNDEGTSDWSDPGEGMTVTPLTVGMASGADPPVSGPFTVRFSFSEPVTGFSMSDIETGQDPACRDDQNNTVFCDAGIGGLETTDDRVFTATVTPWTDRVAHSYTLRLTVPGGAVRSSVGGKPNEEPEEPLEVRVAPPGVTEPISSLGLTASGGNGSVRLSWNRPSDDGGSAIIRYEYRYAAAGEEFGAWENVAAPARSVTAGNLVNGREYVFEVRAVSALGKGGAETVMAVPELRIAPPRPPPAPRPPGNGDGGGLLFPPEAPAGLMAMPGDGTVRLEWGPPASDGGTPILRYEYRLKEGRGAFGEWTPIADSAPEEVNATGYTVGEIGNGTVYVFELRAVNLVGGGRVSEAVEAVMGLDPAYWSNFGAEDLQGVEASLERGPFGGGPQSLRLRFGAGLRFEESELDGKGEVTETRSGSYGYRYTSRTTGELRLDYDGGKTCELRLTFRGEGAGSYRYRCGGVLGGQGSFRMSGLNRGPEITSLDPFEVAENQRMVGQLEAVDQDKQDEITEYGIAGGADGGLFAVEAETGELLFREAPDYENPGDVESSDPESGAGDNEYVVVVEVKSGEGERERKGSRAIRVRVSDEEEPPEITSLGPFEVVENRTMVGQLEAVDPDKQDEITEYGIVGGADAALFAVEAETGELLFREAPDYEDPGDVASEEPPSPAGDNEYIVVVEVSSGEGERERRGSRAIRVRVTDEQEPPEITSVGPFEVAENQAMVGQLEAVDPDEGDEIEGYGITGGADGGLFAVEAETGELLFREAPDYETPGDVASEEPQSGAADNEYIVVVEVRSGEGERERKGSRAIRVRVSDEEEPPEAPAAPVVTAEGSDSLKVSWREPENRGPEIVDYEVRYREGGEAGYRDGGHQGTGLEVRLSGLKEGTVYEVQVRAVNEEGMSEWSEPGEGRTDTEEADPDDPSNFAGEELEGRRLTLRITGEEGAAGSLELRFGEGNRFEQIESGSQQAATRSEVASRSGSYTYERTGPGMGTVRLDYDDGSSCEIRLSFTGTGVGGFAYDCGEGAPAEGSFRLTTGSLFVPVILSAAGRSNSFFTSELTLTNRGDGEVKLDYTYTAHRGGGSGKTSDVLAPGMQKIETDALTYLRGLGIAIPETGNRIGTLRVETRLGSEVEAVVRTTTVVPDGRAGLAYLGVAEEEGFDEAVYLCGLRQNSRDRSNVAFQNMGAEEEGAITLRTTVYSGEAGDTSARVLDDVKLEPGGFHQYSGLLGVLGVPAQGYVKVERVEGTSPFYAYGVINDQANSDGSFIFPVAASWLEGRMGQTLPVIVETSAFRSELTVTNFSEEPRTLDFRFVADAIKTTDKTAGFSMKLEAGEQRIIPEVVEELRRQEVAGLGSTRGFYAGAVFATAEEGNMSGIVIGARTGSEGGGGSYSVFYNAVPFGSAFTEAAWVEGLQQNRENRSNLALVNTGEVDGSASVFHLEIYDGETGLLEQTVATKPIPARGWHQIDGILLRSGPETRQGYIRILKVSGANPFLAYGVVNDGGAPGERSGDGAYLPARE